MVSATIRSLLFAAKRVRRHVGGATIALGIAFAVACASPTLPLPPPSVPSIGASTQAGKVHLASKNGAEPNAIIVIVNQNPAVPLDQRVSGAQADGAGSWDADVLASSHDTLEIVQEYGTTRSIPTDVVVP